MTRAHACVRACANFFFQRVDEERRACARKGGKCVSACGGTTLEVEVEVEVALALALALALEVGAEGRAHTGAQASRRIVVCTAGVSSIGGQLIRSAGTLITMRRRRTGAFGGIAQPPQAQVSHVGEATVNRTGAHSILRVV